MSNTPLERVEKIDGLTRSLHMRFGDPERFHLEKDEALRELGRLRKDLRGGRPEHAFRNLPAGTGGGRGVGAPSPRGRSRTSGG